MLVIEVFAAVCAAAVIGLGMFMHYFFQDEV